MSTEPEPEPKWMPAFPCNEPHPEKGKVFQHGGMALNAYFAAHAPEVPANFPWLEDEDNINRLIRWRWVYATEMVGYAYE